MGLPSAPKRRGEVAEARFIAKALSLGFNILKPFGDSNPYDCVVEHKGRLSRVQVKSAWTEHNNGAYHFTMEMGRTNKEGVRPYRADEVDFVAAYIAPEDAWFVIPICEVLKKTQLKLSLRWKSGMRRFHDRWDLLAGTT